jgi:hypothetical protein
LTTYYYASRRMVAIARQRAPPVAARGGWVWSLFVCFGLLGKDDDSYMCISFWFCVRLLLLMRFLVSVSLACTQDGKTTWRGWGKAPRRPRRSRTRGCRVSEHNLTEYIYARGFQMCTYVPAYLSIHVKRPTSTSTSTCLSLRFLLQAMHFGGVIIVRSPYIYTLLRSVCFL